MNGITGEIVIWPLFWPCLTKVLGSYNTCFLVVVKFCLQIICNVSSISCPLPPPFGKVWCLHLQTNILGEFRSPRSSYSAPSAALCCILNYGLLTWELLLDLRPWKLVLFKHTFNGSFFYSGPVFLSLSELLSPSFADERSLPFKKLRYLSPL